jgi:hypothetical protein
LKAQYINTNNLRGAIIWEITGDYLETFTGSGVIAGTPLVSKLKAVMCGAAMTNCNPTGSTTNITTCSAQLPYSWNGMNYTVAGTYSVHFTNAGGCDSAAVLNLSVYSLPATIKIKTTGASSVCEPDVVNFVLDHTPGTFNSCSYQWNLSGTAINGATDSFYNALASGNYSITITDPTGGCNKTSSSKTATIKTKPTASFTASGATSFCAGSSVTLNAPFISGYSYYWLKDGLSYGAGTSKIIKLAGSYSLMVKLNACYDTTHSPMNITVNPLPIASIISLDTAIICDGDSTTLQAMPSANNNTYYWFNGKSLLDSSFVNMYEAKTTGTYKVMIKDGNGCVSKTSSSAVKEKVKPNPNPTITPLGSTTFANGGSVKLNATPTTGVAWQWNRNGNPIAGGTNKSYVATLMGYYTLRVNQNGCTGLSSPITVTVSSNKLSSEENTWSIYPNPVKEVLTLITNLPFSGKITLTDVAGKQIKHWNFNPSSQEIKLDFHDIVAGIYLLSVLDDAGNFKTYQLIKE